MWSPRINSLKAYREKPTRKRRGQLFRRFDALFTTKTGFITLDRLLARIHANREELLVVLDRPEVPLHTNGSENDIRAMVTRRKLSGGTRSQSGKQDGLPDTRTITRWLGDPRHGEFQVQYAAVLVDVVTKIIC